MRAFVIVHLIMSILYLILMLINLSEKDRAGLTTRVLVTVGWITWAAILLFP